MLLRPCLVTKIFYKIDIVALLFVFDKYYPIMNQLDSKNLSCKLQINYAISYLFYLYLMLHISATIFKVTKNLKNFIKYFGN